MRRRSERKKSSDVSPNVRPPTRRTRSRRTTSKTSDTEKEVEPAEEIQNIPTKAEETNADNLQKEEDEVVNAGKQTNDETVNHQEQTIESVNIQSNQIEVAVEEIATDANAEIPDNVDISNEITQKSEAAIEAEEVEQANSETEIAVLPNEKLLPIQEEVDKLEESNITEKQEEQIEQQHDEQNVGSNNESEKEPSRQSTPVRSEPEEINEQTVDASIEINNDVAIEEEKPNEVQQQQQPQPTDDESVSKTITSDVNNTDNKISENKVNKQQQNDTSKVRKRRWLTKKSEKKAPILAISTDSLKNLIADVHPVPLTDVQLESSSEIEEVASEREEGENTPSPDHAREREREQERVRERERDRRQNSNGKIERIISRDNDLGRTIKAQTPKKHSPTPPRNETSNVLFITNLVRPFTVLQLKSLLARTGKIVEDGFWIDRIKSKCYVQYQTDDEAIETRHALHGVRWPISNPKCLNVDFGDKIDMERAIESSKDDIKVGNENNKDNLVVGIGWNRDRVENDDKKGSRPVREWDVGKKEPLDRPKDRREERDKEKNRIRDQENSKYNDNTTKHDRKRHRDGRSGSLSPVRKQNKKENDPPLRLLDDLFRKTKSTPCIYWLPLTPEQIAEKEAFRQKRIEEHKERIKQRELEREKEKEREREREKEREKEKYRNNEREQRRRDSRDRRRY